jgi:hypothetical protein
LDKGAGYYDNQPLLRYRDSVFYYFKYLNLCMETFIVHPENKQQSAAIKAFLKALKINFEKQEKDSSYNPEFVEQILQGEKARKAGKKGVRIDTDNLWK